MKWFRSKTLSLVLVLVLIMTFIPSHDVHGATEGIDSGTPTGAPASVNISHDNWSGKATYHITFNIWWGNNGTSYKLLENGAEIESGQLNANSPNGQSHTCQITKSVNGTYSYKFEVSNAYGTTGSNTVNVTVTEATGTPTTAPTKTPIPTTTPTSTPIVTSTPTVTSTPSPTNTPVTVTEWKAYTSYKTGDIVSYNGKYYECRQPHTSLPGWEPTNILALWLDTTAPSIAPTTEPTTEPTITPTTEPTTEPTIAPTEPPTPTPNPNTDLPSKILVGYWHSWGGGPSGGVPLVKLRDVDPNWDVINIAFAEPVSPGSTDGRMKMELAGLSSSYTKDDFKQDIKELQKQGKKVVLSIGGYEGYFSLSSTQAINQFVSDIKGFVNEYGFDGIDIDLEQSSVTFNGGSDPDFKNPTSPKIVNMISAIRQICDAYGEDFILSWAPETFYAQLGYQFYGGLNGNVDSRAGVYLPMIYALRDKTTYVHVQLYNSIAVMAPDGKTYSMGNEEATIAMCKMMLDGFNVGGKEEYFFPGLRPDQVVIGVPSSSGAAGSGHISNAALQSAFSKLNSAYPGFRGIMTWSISWDAYQNNNSFATSNGKFLQSLR